MIICIGRAYGSGGAEFAKELAAKLGVACYDRELIEHLVEESNIALDVLEEADEKKENRWLFTAQYESPNEELKGLSAREILFHLQSKVIVEQAKKGDCVFVGRCADYILSEANIPHLSMFVTAEFGDRKSRIMERRNVDEKKATQIVRKTDKQRKAYYDYHTGREWGKVDNYDLCVNLSSDKIGQLMDIIVRTKKETSEPHEQ